MHDLSCLSLFCAVFLPVFLPYSMRLFIHLKRAFLTSAAFPSGDVPAYVCGFAFSGLTISILKVSGFCQAERSSFLHKCFQKAGEPMYCKSNQDVTVDLILNRLDMDTLDHMFRVGSYVNVLARNLWNSPVPLAPTIAEQLPLYGAAAFYHDIGKAFIPLCIITKPGKFSDKERRIMENHPLFANVVFHDVAAGLISGIPESLLSPAWDCAAAHHEWWNGRGYPRGLAQTDIPFIARVTSICDAYDAITSNRAYGKARSHLSACRELQQCSGTQFDPGLVEVFLGCENEIFQIFHPAESSKQLPHPVCSSYAG